MSSPVATRDPAEGRDQDRPVIRVTHDPAVNFAFQQNAIPIVKELRIVNPSGNTPLSDLTVRVTAEPAFAEPLELRIDRLAAGAEFVAAPADVRLSPGFLHGLNEKVLGQLRVEVRSGDLLLNHAVFPVTLLARNEWTGLSSLPELLAAFVLPNDPGVMSILDRAAALLQEHTGRSALNGYQDRSRKRAWEQVAAIVGALGQLGIRYINPPASFENQGQKIRFPGEALAQRFGTCLDLAVLFAACCEQAGLHPVILMHEGHAYAGCWLEQSTLEDPAVDDLQRIRKLVGLETLIVLETTGFTTDPPAHLPQAEQLARPHLERETGFLAAIDIRAARISRIHPLPVPGQPAEHRDAAGAPTSPRPVGLGEREFPPASPMGDSGPEPRVAGRIDQWKSRLLDLSLRNRLLNFKPTRATIPILSAAPEHLEDELAAETGLSVHPRPKALVDPSHPGMRSAPSVADATAALLRQELAQGRIRTGLDEPEHTVRLTELYRAARLALEENGTNTLYAAVGILEWRETEHADRVLRAPILLIPVELRRRSILEGFVLRHLDEEPRLNVTLMEMLRQHFQKEIPGLDPLPTDDRGVDVAAVMRLLREAVRDLPGWEVRTEVWLGQFSFTKFLLWKDLDDRLDVLTRNRVVRHLVQTPDTGYPNDGEDILPAQLDDQFHPRTVFCPRSADSSQLAAVMAAAAGQDLILEGPPGTGKSQTITNIIAHCLAHGKKVLFVAEKRAALDVVHRRLREEGLEPFCLELHSNKTGKAEVLAQFDKALKVLPGTTPAAWAQRADELEKKRSTLNAYARTLHRPLPCGLSPHHCLDYLIPRTSEPRLRLGHGPSILTLSADALATARSLALQLQERALSVGPLHQHPLALVHATEWSPTWSETALAALNQLQAALAPLRAAELSLGRLLGLPSTGRSWRQLAALGNLCPALPQADPVGPAFLGSGWTTTSGALDQWSALARERTGLRTQLAGWNEARLVALDLDTVSDAWQKAQATWFLPRWLALRSVTTTLRSAHETRTRPDAAEVPPLLARARRLKEINTTLTEQNPQATDALGTSWNRGEPDPANLDRIRSWGETLHPRLQDQETAEPPASTTGRLRDRLATLLRADPRSLQPGSDLAAGASAFSSAWIAFETALNRCVACLRLDQAALESTDDLMGLLSSSLPRIVTAWPGIRVWCLWQRTRQEALASRLGALIDRLEQDEAPPQNLPDLFERSFRHDLLLALLDGEPVLRDFFGDLHQGTITTFRKLDEEVAELTRELIRTRLAAALPTSGEPELQTELALVRKELGKKARHIPVRQLLGRIPNLLPRLKPCVLMSPLSVAQYLDPAHGFFDLVIFDEASQIPVWDAIGAIARGRQLVVVGDPKQLPPTQFFARTEETDEEIEPSHEDLESILDELLTHGLRHKRLQWHYRSRQEGLIAFSNRHYYDNELLTFPAAQTHVGGVRFNPVPEAVYDKGRSRTNPREARALVDYLVSRLLAGGTPPRSFGVVTFSQAQQALVEDLLDEERRRNPAIEAHFSDSPPVEGEPVFVKNLENVQGDERDVVLFSICYGPDESGRVSMNFGPLNRNGGERRLNVAITRAKHEVVVFSGLRGDQIDLTRTRARGVRDLKLFLEYAEHGPRALVGATLAGPDSRPDSEFERQVADRLRSAGYEVHHQVGCSGYRVDLAVVDPAAPGRYLLGIECDGASYHSAATARDRDKLRQEVLAGLGWRLHRIWSTDWWHNAEEQHARLLRQLESPGAASGRV